MIAIQHSSETWSHRESEYNPEVWEIMSDWCESPIAELPRWRDDDGSDNQEAWANLLLMTASPRLLAACRLVVARWESGDLAEAARACGAAVAAATATHPSSVSDEIDVEALLAARRQIAAIWGIEDVELIRPDLSDDQRWEVLQGVAMLHDADSGIDWMMIEQVADDLFGDAP